MEIEKRVAELRERLAYTKDIFGGRENANIALMRGTRCNATVAH